jgi:hypothetical protein
MRDYEEFLASKMVKPAAAGFEVDAGRLPDGLFPWQREIVRWARRLGRAALFEDCGLGKTAQQLAWADAVARHTGKPVLILTPLAVAPQTVREGEKFGIAANPCRSQASVNPGVNVTNYQKLLDRKGAGLAPCWDVAAFGGVVLDESSILKSYTGRTKRVLTEAFRETPFRLACTATPAPNDHMELGNHSQFLGVMDSDEMLTRWFINDPSHAGVYTLKRHGAADFWRWVASWAVCVSRPSDLGYADDGFELPSLDVRPVVVEVDESKGADGTLFRCDRLTATTLHKELRATVRERAVAVANLVNGSAEPWVVWCNTDYEADALKAVIPDAVEVRGSMPDEKKEGRMADFAAGRSRVLVTKPSICGFGLNWQHCCKVAFVGLSYSHEQFYQAVRRTWRFGQKRPVTAYVVYGSGEGEVLAAIRRKEEGHETMKAAMAEATRGRSLASPHQRRALRMAGRDVATGDGWTLHLGDCVEVVQGMGPESIDFTIFSPPFSSLYIYSDALQDMGNSSGDDEFFRHFGYLAPELLRVTVPGRLCAVHCKDLPRYATRDGTAGLKDFPGEIIRLFSEHGWSYHSRVTIWKCPVTERERTNTHGLLHKTLKADSSAARQGMADYLLVFRRPPAEGLLSDKPVARPNGLDGYEGDPEHDPRKAAADFKPYHPSPFARYPSNDPALAVWQRYAEPVWWDVNQNEVLNYRLGKGDKDEKHICPLQLGVIRRAVALWTNPGDLVLSPFAGIGSEGHESLLLGRRFVGVELKDSYWMQAQKNLEAAATKARQKDLFGGAAA